MIIMYIVSNFGQKGWIFKKLERKVWWFVSLATLSGLRSGGLASSVKLTVFILLTMKSRMVQHCFCARVGLDN